MEARVKEETGRLNGGKGRTERERFDRVAHTAAIDGSRQKQRVREITRQSRGHRVQDVITELRRTVTRWLNDFGISHTYNQVVALAEWVCRRVRLTYWKQWKRPRTGRRHLLALGIPKDEVKMATRSRKGYWRMSHNSIVQRGLDQ